MENKGIGKIGQLITKERTSNEMKLKGNEKQRKWEAKGIKKKLSGKQRK